MAENIRKSSSALILGAWLVVLLPAAWGLNYTVQNAMKIFTAPAPAAPTAATPGKPA